MTTAGLTDRERGLYYLGGLIAAFVLAYFTGSVLGPSLDEDPPAVDRSDHPGMEMSP